MIALSLQQPWAWLVVGGLKDVENRTWKTNVRGPVYIHASKTFDQDFDFGWAEKLIGAPMPKKTDYYYGGLVGHVDLVDCVQSHPSPWFFGPHGFVLANAVRTPFKPCRGRLGFFAVSFDPAINVAVEREHPDWGGQPDLFGRP